MLQQQQQQQQQQTGLILTYTLEIGVPILLPEYHNRMQHAKVWYLCFS